ncbi:hypothetical protein Hanom_Chr05g00401501 [Helianthus anomalus]
MAVHVCWRCYQELNNNTLRDIIYTESGIIAIVVLPLVFKRNSSIKPHFV